jgi:hypothetical protein
MLLVKLLLKSRVLFHPEPDFRFSKLEGFCQVSRQLALGVVEGRMPSRGGRGRWTARIASQPLRHNALT